MREDLHAEIPSKSQKQCTQRSFSVLLLICQAYQAYCYLVYDTYHLSAPPASSACFPDFQSCVCQYLPQAVLSPSHDTRPPTNSPHTRLPTLLVFPTVTELGLISVHTLSSPGPRPYGSHCSSEMNSLQLQGEGVASLQEEGKTTQTANYDPLP